MRSRIDKFLFVMLAALVFAAGGTLVPNRATAQGESAPAEQTATTAAEPAEDAAAQRKREAAEKAAELKSRSAPDPDDHDNDTCDDDDEDCEPAAPAAATEPTRPVSTKPPELVFTNKVVAVVDSEAITSYRVETFIIWNTLAGAGAQINFDFGTKRRRRALQKIVEAALIFREADRLGEGPPDDLRQQAILDNIKGRFATPDDYEEFKKRFLISEELLRNSIDRKVVADYYSEQRVKNARVSDEDRSGAWALLDSDASVAEIEDAALFVARDRMRDEWLKGLYRKSRIRIIDPKMALGENEQ